MNDPKRHHYCPVFYLRQWAGADGKIARYHRPYDRVDVKRRAPDNVGYEEFLYSVEGQSDPQMLEKGFFQNVDNDAAPLLTALSSLGRSGLVILGNDLLDDQKRSAWTRFVSSLWLRGPYSLAEIDAVLQGNLRRNMERKYGEEYRAEKQPGDPDSVYDFARKDGPDWLPTAHKFLLADLIDHQPVGQFIVNMVWGVLDLSGGPYSLLTSDRPYTTSHGLLSPECVLRLPISPTRLFIAANRMDRLHALSRQPRKDAVRDCNNLVVRMAVDNVYGLGSAELAFVEKRLRKRGQPPVPGIIMAGR